MCIADVYGACAQIALDDCIVHCVCVMARVCVCVFVYNVMGLRLSVFCEYIHGIYQNKYTAWRAYAYTYTYTYACTYTDMSRYLSPSIYISIYRIRIYYILTCVVCVARAACVARVPSVTCVCVCVCVRVLCACACVCVCVCVCVGVDLCVCVCVGEVWHQPSSERQGCAICAGLTLSGRVRISVIVRRAR